MSYSALPPKDDISAIRGSFANTVIREIKDMLLRTVGYWRTPEAHGACRIGADALCEVENSSESR
jgi:hypothetical protein